MQSTRRALYNSIRFSWLIDKTLKVEPWQVENYREMSLPLIFSRLRQLNFDFDKDSFLAISENYTTPEDLTEDLFEEEEIEGDRFDRVYLLIFELWRRLEKEKQCLSIFCDELDHQIFLYDQGLAKSAEDIQDILSNLQVILDENSDEGADPVSVFLVINESSAHDIESFLYDFIQEQIENENDSYAMDLLDSFENYIQEKKWFELLRVRIVSHTDTESAENILNHLAKIALKENDLIFNLEVLSELVQEGDQSIFTKLALSSVPLLNNEEDFQDLVAICRDYYRCLDLDDKEDELQTLLNSRKKLSIKTHFDPAEPAALSFLKIIS